MMRDSLQKYYEIFLVKSIYCLTINHRVFLTKVRLETEFIDFRTLFATVGTPFLSVLAAEMTYQQRAAN